MNSVSICTIRVHVSKFVLERILMACPTLKYNSLALCSLQYKSSLIIKCFVFLNRTKTTNLLLPLLTVTRPHLTKWKLARTACDVSALISHRSLQKCSLIIYLTLFFCVICSRHYLSPHQLKLTSCLYYACMLQYALYASCLLSNHIFHVVSSSNNRVERYHTCEQ